MIKAKIRYSAKTRLNKNGIYYAGLGIVAIFVVGVVLAVEMVDAINRNRNG